MSQFYWCSSSFYFISLMLVVSTEAAPILSARGWKNSLKRILNDILTDHFPPCDIILMQDPFFTLNMNNWVATIKFPYYSITLDGQPFPDYTAYRKITKTTGFLCSTIIALCETFETCRHNDSSTLFRMLSANGILLKERRAILYIDKYSDKDDVPYSLSNTTDKWTTTHENPVGQEYSLSVMTKAKHILSELNCHITIIRDVTKNLLRKKKRHTSLMNTTTENLDANGTLSENNFIFETITFSPNWIPGGTPLVPNLWSTKRGFTLAHPPMLDIRDIRPGAAVKFCLPSKNLLPFIDVASNGSTTGFDAEIINLFRRHVKIIPEFFEAPDKRYSTKDKDGNWSGTIGLVVRKEADIGLGQVTFTHDKILSGLKFSPVVTTLNAVAVCPIPRLLPRYQIFVYPFETTTWIHVLVSFVLSVVVFEVLQRVAIRLMPMEILVSSSHCGKNRSKFKNMCQSKLPWIQSVGPIFQKSVTVTTLPGRWAILGLFSIWLLSTFITAITYVTLLIGALTVPPREPYVHSPADLLNTKKEWTVSTLVESAIEHSTVPSEIKLLQGAKSITDLPEYKFLPADIRDYSYVNRTGKCAVTEEYRSRFYIGSEFSVRGTHNKRKLLYVSKGSLFISASGWALRDDMDFMLESYFDKIFLEVTCFGLQDKMIHGWSPQHHKVENSVEPLSIETVYIVFEFGGFGLLVSLLVFVCELIVQRFLAEIVAVKSRLMLGSLSKDIELYPFTW